MIMLIPPPLTFFPPLNLKFNLFFPQADLRKHYDLADPEWKYDIMPEIWDGHNIADL